MQEKTGKALLLVNPKARRGSEAIGPVTGRLEAGGLRAAVADAVEAAAARSAEMAQAADEDDDDVD